VDNSIYNIENTINNKISEFNKRTGFIEFACAQIPSPDENGSLCEKLLDKMLWSLGWVESSWQL